jgi:hypothetical protein
MATHWVENDRRKQCLSALPCRLNGTPLTSSTVKSVEDIFAVAGLTVVDEVLPPADAVKLLLNKVGENVLCGGLC